MQSTKKGGKILIHMFGYCINWHCGLQYSFNSCKYFYVLVIYKCAEGLLFTVNVLQ